jgi:hypothetical protein
MAVDFDKIALKRRVRRIVDALPQRSVIPDEVAERWIDGIIDRDPDRAEWHARRAGGIGGSEIGELVLHASGQRTTYSTLEEISQQKLLLAFPSRATIHMARGTAMEPLADRTYHAISKHESILGSPEIAKAFRAGHPKYPWLIGNPDDVVNAEKIGHIVTDFKVRSNLGADDPMKLVNACQLHWYGLIYEGSFGELPKAYCLAELDIPGELMDALRSEESPDFDSLAKTIASVNKPGFGMQIRHFKHNPALAGHMIRLADQFWNKYIMAGTPFTKPKLEKPAEMSDFDAGKVKELLNDLVRFKIAEGVSKTEGDRVKAELLNLTSDYQIDEWPFAVPGLSAGYSKLFDLSTAATALMIKGVKREDISKPSTTLDTDAAMETLQNNGLLNESLYKPSWDTRAVKAALKAEGLSADDFEKTGFRAGISTKKADQETRDTLNVHMGVHIHQFGRQEQKPNNGVIASETEAPVNGLQNTDILPDFAGADDYDDCANIDELRIG